MHLMQHLTAKAEHTQIRAQIDEAVATTVVVRHRRGNDCWQNALRRPGSSHAKDLTGPAAARKQSAQTIVYTRL